MLLGFGFFAGEFFYSKIVVLTTMSDMELNKNNIITKIHAHDLESSTLKENYLSDHPH